MSALNDITKEVRRQQEKYTKDAQYKNGELLVSAQSILGQVRLTQGVYPDSVIVLPCTADVGKKGMRQMLIIAAALIHAEVDRLDKEFEEDVIDSAH